MKKSLLSEFAKYASLNVLGMIGISGYILADTFFVSKALGPTGIAALNLAISIFSILQGIGLLIGMGGSTRFSILKSQKEDDKASIVFSTSIKLGLLISLILFLVGLFGTRGLSLILGADSTTLPLTNTYLSTILIFSPFFILNNILLAFVRNDNKPKLSMIAMLIGSFSNIILDYLFLFPLGMGMFGAAFATSLAPIISICILLFPSIKRKNSFLLFLKNRIAWPLIPDIFKLGLSSFIAEVSSAVVLITFNLVILRIEGNLGVAAYGIVANLALIGTALFTGLAQGMQPLASRYYGSNQYPIAKKVWQYALQTSISLAIIIYVGVYNYSESIIDIFNSESNIAMAQMAETGLRIYFLGFLFVGTNIIASQFLSSVERTREAFIISISRGLIIIVPLVLILSKIWNMKGVWVAFVLTELLVTILARYLSNARKKLNKSVLN